MVLSYELILGATRVSKGGQKCKRSVESSSTLPRPFPAVRQRLRRAFFFFLYRQHYGKIAGKGATSPVLALPWTSLFRGQRLGDRQILAR